MIDFDGENWPCFMWLAIGLIGACAVLGASYGLPAQAKADAEIAKDAMKSGYVQKVVEVRGEIAHVIWTKDNCKCSPIVKLEEDK